MPGLSSSDILGSLRALVSDVYVNLKLGMKLDLPKSRETVPDLFDRVRRQFPAMDLLKPYKDELALETSGSTRPYRWLAVRPRSIRSGVVNPDAWEEAHGLHAQVLELAPYFLSISPLDIESVEVLFGVDLISSSNHDEAVFNALIADSPLGHLVESSDRVVDCQPLLSWSVGFGAGIVAQYEIKTRVHDASRAEGHGEALSIYLTVRRQGPVLQVSELADAYRSLAAMGERLMDERVLPYLVSPIRAALAAG